uniref:Ig-like domain-containing protein n=1 Tax=Sciurus vulgaris TaxID=55149 RepID=A0A8D2B5F7_SCIVU
MACSPACLIFISLLCQFTEYLSKPKVTMGLQNNKNGTCITNLTCSMEQGGEDVTYSWKALGQGGNKSHNGSILPISWRLGERDLTFICTARNPISNSSSSPILAWKLCKEPTDSEKRMDIHREIPNVCPHSGENTVYEIIRYANKINAEEDPLSTLYSTVQIPKKVENPCSLTTKPDPPRLFTYENVI